MENLLAKFFDFEKVPTKLIFVLWLISGIVIFTPENYLIKLKISEVEKLYSFYIGLTFLFTTAFIIVSAASFIYNKYQSKINRTRIKNDIIESIHNLDHFEKATLREFFLNGAYTIQLPIADATVNGLANKRLIFRASAISLGYQMNFAFTISKIVVEEINKNPSLLDLPNHPSENWTNSELENLKRKRPVWIKDEMEY